MQENLLNLSGLHNLRSAHIEFYGAFMTWPRVIAANERLYVHICPFWPIKVAERRELWYRPREHDIRADFEDLTSSFALGNLSRPPKHNSQQR